MRVLGGGDVPYLAEVLCGRDSTRSVGDPIDSSSPTSDSACSVGMSIGRRRTLTPRQRGQTSAPHQAEQLHEIRTRCRGVSRSAEGEQAAIECRRAASGSGGTICLASRRAQSRLRLQHAGHHGTRNGCDVTCVIRISMQALRRLELPGSADHVVGLARTSAGSVARGQSRVSDIHPHPASGTGDQPNFAHVSSPEQ